jgi:hypothetical protein
LKKNETKQNGSNQIKSNQMVDAIFVCLTLKTENVKVAIEAEVKAAMLYIKKHTHTERETTKKERTQFHV